MKNNFIIQLAKAQNKKNRKNVSIMIFTIAIVLLGMYSIFTLLFGKINVDKVQAIRNNGTTAAGLILNGEEKQKEEIEKLNYIDTIGSINQIGMLVENDQEFAQIAICNEKTFNNFYAGIYECCGEISRI